MSKFILSLTVIGLALLSVFGMTEPSSPVVWMASTSSNFEVLRIGLILMLASLLITNPPRSVYLRVFVGAISAFLFMWSISATYGNQMKFLDTFSLLAASISSWLTVLELDEFEPADELDIAPPSLSDKSHLAAS